MTTLSLLSILISLIALPADEWTLQTSGTVSRLRGVSVLSDREAWASGAGGTVVATDDAGRTWRTISVPDSDGLDFRDVEAINAQVVYLLSIGEGEKSRIFKTTDAGKTWATVYQYRDPKGFLDAISFWDAEHGLALGDPVQGRFTILTTDDGGKTWNPVDPAGMPEAQEGEGAFAASGTCLVTFGDRHVWFGTGGGKTARVFRSDDRGRTWTAHETPIRAGTPTSGIFSLAFRDETHGVIVGGSYDREQETGKVAATTDDGGKTWSVPTGEEPRGFRSAVAYVHGGDPSQLIAVGPSGSDMSLDGGRSWKKLGDTGFHAMRFDASGVGWAVGEQGRVARIAVPASRTFEIMYRATVKDVPKTANQVDLWIPLPQSDPNQTIDRITVTATGPISIGRESKFGNTCLHLTSNDTTDAVGATITIRATRRENAGRPEPLDEADRRTFLADEPLVPLTGVVADLAREATAGMTSDAEKARAIYEKVTGMMAYDKTGEGWGRGDAVYACDAKRGNCTDFHALIIGMARASGIPARFAIGLPLPETRGEGEIAGYHCWAEVYLDGRGWVPLDSSEARKHPEKHDYFFGHHDENRLEFSRGRHLTLEPPQNGPPLNFFVYPYAEVDGKPHTAIDRKFTFRDQP